MYERPVDREQDDLLDHRYNILDDQGEEDAHLEHTQYSCWSR